jgi:hypothetical protein
MHSYELTITFDEEIKLIELREKLNRSEFGSHLSQLTCRQAKGERTTSINARIPQSSDKIFQKK